jgi:hypothetical protein
MRAVVFTDAVRHAQPNVRVYDVRGFPLLQDATESIRVCRGKVSFSQNFLGIQASWQPGQDSGVKCSCGEPSPQVMSTTTAGNRTASRRTLIESLQLLSGPREYGHDHPTQHIWRDILLAPAKHTIATQRRPKSASWLARFFCLAESTGGRGYMPYHIAYLPGDP